MEDVSCYLSPIHANAQYPHSSTCVDTYSPYRLHFLYLDASRFEHFEICVFENGLYEYKYTKLRIFDLFPKHLEGGGNVDYSPPTHLPLSAFPFSTTAKPSKICNQEKTTKTLNQEKINISNQEKTQNLYLNKTTKQGKIFNNQDNSQICF